jgi:hypothetical protein
MVMGQYSVQGDMGVSPTHNPPILASSPTRPTDAPSTAVAADLRFLDYRRSRWGKQAGRDRSMFCSSKAARDDEAGDVQGFRGPGGIPDAKGATDEEYDGLDIRPGGPRAGLPAGDHRQSLPPDGHHRRHLHRHRSARRAPACRVSGKGRNPVTTATSTGEGSPAWQV